jgi:RNA polymerase sigma factor (sigma-70 family)
MSKSFIFAWTGVEVRTREEDEDSFSRFGNFLPLHPHYFNVNDTTNYYGPGTDLKFKLLSAEEEQALFAKARGENATATQVRDAREFLITNHLLFAMTYARKLVRGKLPDNEVVSAANFGLMKAFEAFDHKRGTRFAAYAKPYIRSEIQSLWRSKDIVDYHGNYPDDEAGETLTLVDADEGIVQPDVEGDSKELILQCLKESKRVLTAKEAKVLRMFYEEDLNLREIGDTLGITRARVHQIHNGAVEKLRRAFKKAGVDKQGEV